MHGLLAVIFIIGAVLAENGCPPEQANDWSIEKLLAHEDCDKFYKCTYGEPVEQLCPSNLYFNIRTLQCDWQANVDCNGRNDADEAELTTVTTESEITSELTTTSSSSSSSSESWSSSESVLSKSSSSESSTTTLKSETSTEAVTDSSSESSSSDSSTSESASSKLSSESLESSSSESTTTTPKTETTTEAVTDSSSESSSSDSSSTESSSSESSFSSDSSTDTLSYESEETEADTTAQPTTESVEELLSNGCPVNPYVHWLLPHESDCNLFYYCVWGEKVKRACPATLHFNRTIQVCDWPENANCVVTQLSANKHFGGRGNTHVIG